MDERGWWVVVGVFLEGGGGSLFRGFGFGVGMYCRLERTEASVRSGRKRGESFWMEGFCVSA
jgi:hypothetical protein